MVLSSNLRVTPQSDAVSAELRKLGIWVQNSEKFEHKKSGFYELVDEEDIEKHIKAFLTTKQIAPTRKRIFRASGPGHPTLYASSGRLDIYPLRIHEHKSPTVGGRDEHDQKVSLEVGTSITITSENCVSPGVDFLTLSGGSLEPLGSETGPKDGVCTGSIEGAATQG